MSFNNKSVMRSTFGFAPLRDPELFADMKGTVRHFAPGTDLGVCARTSKCVFILREGWATTSKILRNGDRQILDIKLPGDSLGLRHAFFNCADYRIEPLTDVVALKVSTCAIMESLTGSKERASHLLWTLTLEQAIASERIVNLGRRDSVKRTVHFLLELSERLRPTGSDTPNGFDCPLSQSDLADTLGMSVVHVNRVLRKLREEDLLTFHAGRVHFKNREALIEFAEFEPDYLNNDLP